MSLDERPDQQPEEKKPGLIQRSKDMIDSAVLGIKGRDMNALVDEFTSEMTLVAEGFHEDLVRAQQELAQLSAEQTIAHERAQDQEERLRQLQKRVEALEKRQEKQAAKKPSRLGVLRQVIIIVAIVCGAWVITSLLQTFGGVK